MWGARVLSALVETKIFLIIVLVIQSDREKNHFPRLLLLLLCCRTPLASAKGAALAKGRRPGRVGRLRAQEPRVAAGWAPKVEGEKRGRLTSAGVACGVLNRPGVAAGAPKPSPSDGCCCCCSC